MNLRRKDGRSQTNVRDVEEVKSVTWESGEARTSWAFGGRGNSWEKFTEGWVRGLFVVVAYSFEIVLRC